MHREISAAPAASAQDSVSYLAVPLRGAGPTQKHTHTHTEARTPPPRQQLQISSGIASNPSAYAGDALSRQKFDARASMKSGSATIDPAS